MQKRVLVVDDEVHVHFAVREIFTAKGIEVLAADSGQACLEELARGFRGVILMDIMMPHMDGWDTIREIIDQGYHQDNIILMLTALSVPDSKMDGLQEHVLGYITKPFEREDLVSTVSRYLEYLA
jgi:CheY-like chemotaxis protein